MKGISGWVTLIVVTTLVIGIARYITGDSDYPMYKWQGFYYPNPNDFDYSGALKRIESPELSSLEECQNWVNIQVQSQGRTDSNWDYECGRKCRFESSYGETVCKETLK